MKSRTSLPESDDDEVIRKMDEIMKDPEKFKGYVASRLDRAHELAEALGSDKERLCRPPPNQKQLPIRPALLAWNRSSETFGEEIVALNDIDQTLK